MIVENKQVVPFFVDQDNKIIFPKREIYKNTSHETWFRDEGIPLFGVIRGYMFEDHILVFVNDYEIPPLHPGIIMEWFNTYESLNYIEMGVNRVENNQVAKLLIFRGKDMQICDAEEPEKPKPKVKRPKVKKNLLQEAKVEKKPVGYEVSGDQ
ncbi:MAG: hypothetical protein Nk1A_8360 [Endomicrobiia bacterium]|nr:MAG: hypothetical protein Nk1A_8360 [Endomicrobiia bacterium]